jgi:hypothetical protein
MGRIGESRQKRLTADLPWDSWVRNIGCRRKAWSGHGHIYRWSRGLWRHESSLHQRVAEHAIATARMIVLGPHRQTGPGALVGWPSSSNTQRYPAVSAQFRSLEIQASAGRTPSALSFRNHRSHSENNSGAESPEFSSIMFLLPARWGFAPLQPRCPQMGGNHAAQRRE